MGRLVVTGGIVTYNNEDMIDACIGSILKYTRGCRFKLYVYDNGSSDRTVRIIRQNFPQVAVLRGKRNRGFGYGHNQIIRRVTSDYHVVINPDIGVDTDAISRMAEFMHAHPQIGLLVPRVLNPDGTEQYLQKMQPNFRSVFLSKFKRFRSYRDVFTMADRQVSSPVRCTNISGSFFMADTKKLKQLGGFDPRYFMYYEDSDLAMRMGRIAQIVYHPGIYVYHAWKRDNMRSIRGVCRYFSSMIKYIVRWRRF